MKAFGFNNEEETTSQIFGLVNNMFAFRKVEEPSSEVLISFYVQVIAAEGEQKSSKALKEASDIITESPAALQLR